MKLSFLGQSYEATVTPVETMVTTETAIFLGPEYTRKQVTAAMHQPAAELTYRGVRYTA